jgi:hypothetical protein
LSKVRAVQLTEGGKIDAVVATSRSGSKFLRARPNDETGDNFGTMGT